MSKDNSAPLQRLLSRMRLRDEAARHELIECAYDRLRRLARVILNESFPRLKGSPGLMQTTEVANEVALGMYELLREVRPATVRDFFRVAAQRIRWLLLDRAKKIDRAQRQARENSPADEAYSSPRPWDATDPADDLDALYQQIEGLPENEREVVALLYFHGLSQVETAAMLDVAERTVRRYWTSARLKLMQGLRPQALIPLLANSTE
jgi:RNA polymerase sigma-70 factor (ECF subfamily)